MRLPVRLIGLVALSAAGGAQPAMAASGSPIEARRAETLSLEATGTLRIDDTWGEVMVEGWDRSAVEVVMTARSKKSHPDADAAEIRDRLARFGFTAQAASSAEARLIGMSPKASLLKPFGGKSGVSVAYAIRMPRTANLILEHDVGEVAVRNVGGDVEVAVGTGSAHLALPNDTDVAIKASARIGDIELGAHLRGKGELKQRALVGQTFLYQPPDARRHVVARVGVGSIAID